MSEYQPLSTRAELQHLNMDECLEGYRSGLAGDAEPGTDKSKSFWHGWRNGAMDRGLIAPDAASIQLANEIVRHQRAH
jgi:hypothetical protein